MLTISAFYLDKQKSFIPKKHMKCTMYYGQFFLQPTDAVLSLNSPSIYGSATGQEDERKSKYLLEKIWLSSKYFSFFQSSDYSLARAELAQARKRDYEKNTHVEKFNETDALIAAQARKRVEKFNEIDALILQLETEGLAD